MKHVARSILASYKAETELTLKCFIPGWLTRRWVQDTENHPAAHEILSSVCRFTTFTMYIKTWFGKQVIIFLTENVILRALFIILLHQITLNQKWSCWSCSITESHLYASVCIWCHYARRNDSTSSLVHDEYLNILFARDGTQVIILLVSIVSCRNDPVWIKYPEPANHLVQYYLENIRFILFDQIITHIEMILCVRMISYKVGTLKYSARTLLSGSG